MEGYERPISDVEKPFRKVRNPDFHNINIRRRIWRVSTLQIHDWKQTSSHS